MNKMAGETKSVIESAHKSSNSLSTPQKLQHQQSKISVEDFLVTNPTPTSTIQDSKTNQTPKTKPQESDNTTLKQTPNRKDSTNTIIKKKGKKN
jgi:hypothetical protein